MAVDYTYSIASDTANGAVNLATLDNEIRATASDASAPIIVALIGTSANGDVLTITFAATISNDEEGKLNTVVANHQGNITVTPQTADGVPVVTFPSRQIDGTPQVAQGVRIGKEVIKATHNFADACTWWSESERVTSATLTPLTASGSGSLHFSSSHMNWIDMVHGRVFDEDNAIERAKTQLSAAHGYSVEVWVDGVKQSIATPLREDEFDGDFYVVDYSSGIIQFSEPITGTVSASYSYADTSGWIAMPDSGEVITIEKAEIQFTEDIGFDSTLVMETYGYADYFAPQLGLPPGTYIPISTTYYKTMGQLIDESIQLFPPFPDIGGSRRIGSPIRILQFNYSVAKRIYSSLGMFLKIYLEPDRALGGSRAVGTFYLMSNDDPGAAAALAELTTPT